MGVFHRLLYLDELAIYRGYCANRYILRRQNSPRLNGASSSDFHMLTATRARSVWAAKLLLSRSVRLASGPNQGVILPVLAAKKSRSASFQASKVSAKKMRFPDADQIALLNFPR